MAPRPPREIAAVVSQYYEITANTIKRATLSIHQELVTSTPIDTGFARASWVPSLNVQVTGKPSPNAANPAADVAAAQARQAKGVGDILSLKSLEGINVVWISNNVVYLNKLNEGSSKQAPAKYVEAAIETGIKGAF